MVNSQPDRTLQTRSDLLNALWYFQDTFGYIRDEDVAFCAKRLHVSKVEIEGIVSFYHFFHRKSAGKFTIYLNNSTISQGKDFDAVKEALERVTGARFGGVDPTGTFGLFETSCIGLSDLETSVLDQFSPFYPFECRKGGSCNRTIENGCIAHRHL